MWKQNKWSNMEVLGFILLPVFIILIEKTDGILDFISIIGIFLSSGMYWGEFNKD